jgi:choline-sulfatase
MGKDRPNIVVFLSDDHGQWATGCYGNREVRTPSIDWLARRGVRMANAMTPTPVCSPARATFWTGLYPSQHGIHDYLAAGEYRNAPWIEVEEQLGEVLARQGYRCGFFGKWHCGTPEETRPGFEEWFSIGRRTGPHRGEQVYVRSDEEHDGEEYRETGYQSRITTDAALRFIDRAAGGTTGGEAPFFAFVGLVSTHSPYRDHPPRLVESYRDASFVDIPREPVHPFGRLTGEGKNAADERWDERQAQYYASVTEIDEQVGRVLDLLDQRGVLDDTLVVYTSDHGLNVGHHGLFGKGNATRPLNMVEESIRIPMVFGAWTGLFAQQVRAEFVDHADLFETLCAVAGATQGAPSAGRGPRPGRSFLPLLTRAQSLPDWKQVQLGEYGDLRMARSATLKLIRRHGRGADQLFDLERDPRETRNAIDDPAYAQTLALLDRAIDDHFAPVADSPKNGLRVAELRSNNPVESWRGEQE